MCRPTCSNMPTLTITIGDRAENHVHMQMIGTAAPCGFNAKELETIQTTFEDKGTTCELIDLAANRENVQSADLLVIRNGVDVILEDDGNADELYEENSTLPFDKKAKMYGRVCNKKARHNLCYGLTSQEPDYEAGKGRIIAFTEVLLLNLIMSRLVKFFGEKAANLVAEANWYYDILKCGIGFHGDAERRIVIGIRLGETIPLHYQWFFKGKPVGERIKVNLNHGDIYVMSDKATGYDWKKKNIPTLRHAAGCKKFLTINS